MQEERPEYTPIVRTTANRTVGGNPRHHEDALRVDNAAYDDEPLPVPFWEYALAFLLSGALAVNGYAQSSDNLSTGWAFMTGAFAVAATPFVRDAFRITGKNMRRLPSYACLSILSGVLGHQIGNQLEERAEERRMEAAFKDPVFDDLTQEDKRNLWEACQRRGEEALTAPKIAITGDDQARGYITIRCPSLDQ